MTMRRYSLTLLAVLLFSVGSTTAFSQRQPGGPGNMELGNKALKGGNFKAAIKYFSRAMRANGIESKDVAVALLNRGIAHREAGKAGQAIADINAALFLKELPSTLTARAYFHRGLAYRAVGMAKRGSTDLGEAKRLAPGDKVIAQGLKALGSGVKIASRPATVPSFSTTTIPTSTSRRNERSTRAPQAKPKPNPVIGSFQTEVRTEPQRRTPTAPTQPKRTAPPAQAPLASWSTSVTTEEEPKPEPKTGRVGRFFGNLWGSSDKKNEEQVAATQQTAAQQTAPAAAPVGAGGGKYRLQLASVKSENEAQKVWSRISSRHKSLIGARQPTIEKMTLGTLGTFYRLQIGPFSDKAESLKLCNSFKRSGVECFLISR